MNTKLVNFVALALLLFARLGACEDIHVNVMGCVLSLPNINDATIAGTGDITFSFRPAESSQVHLITVGRFPGYEAWNAKPKNERSEVSYSTFLGFKERIIVMKGIHLPDSTFRELTDGYGVIFTKDEESEFGNILKCDK